MTNIIDVVCKCGQHIKLFKPSMELPPDHKYFLCSNCFYQRKLDNDKRYKQMANDMKPGLHNPKDRLDAR